MGEVYEGVDETLDSKVAVKVLLSRLALDASFKRRFFQEARAACKVKHPNVVQIMDFGESEDGSVFFVMEFLEGLDLHQLLHREGPMPWPRARHILLQIASAIGATHDCNIVHRDIKPSNFFIQEARGFRDFIKLLDFGIAKQGSEPEGGGGHDLGLTRTGEMFGTAKYMAPELAYGPSSDPRIDVYAVGVVAYEMLTGGVPFTGTTAFEILKKHVDEEPRPLSMANPLIPDEVEAMVMKALAKDPNDRFASMDDMEEAIDSIGENAALGALTRFSRSLSGAPSESERAPGPARRRAKTSSPGPSRSVGPSVTEQITERRLRSELVAQSRGGGVRKVQFEPAPDPAAEHSATQVRSLPISRSEHRPAAPPRTVVAARPPRPPPVPSAIPELLAEVDGSRPLNVGSFEPLREPAPPTGTGDVRSSVDLRQPDLSALLIPPPTRSRLLWSLVLMAALGGAALGGILWALLGSRDGAVASHDGHEPAPAGEALAAPRAGQGGAQIEATPDVAEVPIPSSTPEAARDQDRRAEDVVSSDEPGDADFEEIVLLDDDENPV